MAVHVKILHTYNSSILNNFIPENRLVYAWVENTPINCVDCLSIRPIESLLFAPVHSLAEHILNSDIKDDFFLANKSTMLIFGADQHYL